MTKKILFVYANVLNRWFVPIAVPILSGVAKKRGAWETDYFDTRYYQEIEKIVSLTNGIEQVSYDASDKTIAALQEKLNSYKPDMIAVSVASYRNFALLETLLSKVNIPANIPVVVGGSHVTIHPDTFIKSKLFDVVCLGEGETIFNDVLDRMEKNDILRGVRGTVWVNKKTGESEKAERRLFEDPHVIWDNESDYSMFDEKYFTDPSTYVHHHVEASRGCPFDCHYCGNHALKDAFKGLGTFLRDRPIESLFKHLNQITRAHPDIKGFRFTDESFLHKSIAWLEEFADIYSKSFTQSMIISERAELISEEKVKILAKCGVMIDFAIGVESGSDELLRDICNRTCKSSHVVKAFDLIHRYGMHGTALCMLGIPNETREDAFKTTQLLRLLKPENFEVSIFVPYPGTALHKFCIDRGYTTEEETLRVKITRMPELRYDSLNEMVAYPIVRMPKPYLSQKDILNFRRVFDLYVFLPEEYFPLVEKCEKNYESNKRTFNMLMDLKEKILSGGLTYFKPSKDYQASFNNR